MSRAGKAGRQRGALAGCLVAAGGAEAAAAPGRERPSAGDLQAAQEKRSPSEVWGTNLSRERPC